MSLRVLSLEKALSLERVLSLDVANKTGWAFISSSLLRYGLIKVDSKLSEAKRLVYFRNELKKLLKKLKPSHIVIEDVYSGKNVNTLKLLAKFGGVAQECCLDISGVEPYIMHNRITKSYFKVKNKRELFDFALTVFDWKDNDITFEKYNDIVDAICQLFCYYDLVLNVKEFRKEKDYGYLYSI